jgi:hypothetical protein
MTTKAQEARVATELANAKMHDDARAKKHAVLAARKPRPASRESAHANRKASYVLEDHGEARPTRKSTRKASNRVKADANLTLREQRTKSAPKVRRARAVRQTKRVRGHTR